MKIADKHEAYKDVARVNKWIVTIGDVSLDHLQHESESEITALNAASRRKKGGRSDFGISRNYGGAWLIGDLLHQHQKFSGACFEVCSHTNRVLASEHNQTFLEIGKFSKNGDDNKSLGYIYRVSRFVGSREGRPQFSPAELDNATLEKAKASKAPSVVLTIVNAQFVPKAEDSKDSTWSMQRECAAHIADIERETKGRHFVIVKALWPVASVVWAELLDLKERLLIVLNADDLRNAGFKISRGLSWDRTASEVILALKNAAFNFLRNCHLIIRFGLDAAMHCKGDKIDFYYDPSDAEGDYALKFRDSTMSGFASVFCASLAIDFENAFDDQMLDAGIRRALIAARRLLEFGYKISPARFGIDPRIAIDHYEVFDRSDQSIRRIAKRTLEPKSYLLQSKAWAFLGLIVGDDLKSLAKGIVADGNVPPDRFGVPHARLGKLETLDRSEIESYRGIRNLLSEYAGLSPKSANRPLCIAVFGPPGTGKSFGVREVARSISLGNIEMGLEFNVAQFTSVDDLTASFHAVRDVGLRGKVPLVFFDEFDAKFNDALGWLKYFLAPMQDGLFKEGELMHPIGKSIFVFAGGRSHSFSQFCSEFDQKKDGHKKEGQELARDAKLPDFISRLRGHVNIIGPNQRDNDDQFFIVRRATVLRSLMVEKCAHLIHRGKLQINSSVLHAFLHVPHYRHGVRSMEALIDMSTLSGKKTFDKSALPTRDQMDMHVDAEEFGKLVEV